MSKKQLKPEQWLYYFDLYQKDYYKFVYEYSVIAKRKWENSTTRYYFKSKMNKYLYNKDIGVLMSNTGKSSKKGKGSGRPNKSLNEERKKIFKIVIDEMDSNEIEENLNNYLEILKETNREKYDELIKKIIKTSSLSSRKLSLFLGISKSHICRIRNGWTKKIRIPKKHIQLIINIFFEYKAIKGREPIAAILFQRHGILLSSRQVGRILSENGLKSIVRTKTRKQREIKNVEVNIPDIVKRDYDNKNHKETILATDVTYIPAPNDVKGNHIYLSATINHRNKEIVGFKISEINDTKLIIDSIKDISIDNVIIHSDHGSVYSSTEFQKLINKKNWIQSMGEVGNSLDNREIEHWFGILKTELIHNINTKALTYDELVKLIEEWIEEYNFRRIQKKLDWKTPSQV